VALVRAALAILAACGTLRSTGRAISVVGICEAVTIIIDTVAAIRLLGWRCPAVRGAVALVLTQVAGAVAADGRRSTVDGAIEAVLLALAGAVAAAVAGSAIGAGGSFLDRMA
jgi:hypothetical protein